MAGKAKFTNVAVGDTPDSGVTDVYVDATSKKLSSKDDAGVVTDYSAHNVTHTGDVTGADALTIDPTAITGKTLVSAAVDDNVLIADTGDSGNLKKVTVQTIVDLAAGSSIYQNPVDTTWKLRFQEFSIEDGNRYQAGIALVGAASTGATIADVALGAGDEARIGIARYSNGTTYASFYQALSNTRFSGADHRIGAACKHSTIADGTNDFLWWVGYSQDGNSIGSYMSCIGIDRTISTTNYIAFTRQASTQTSIDTGVAFDTGWHNFEVVVNADNTSHTFYIDGTLVGTSTTNLPDASMSPIGFISNVAGASRSFDIDWLYVAHKPSTARGTIHTWLT